MSHDSASPHERAAIQHMMRRLDGFARGLGLDDVAMRRLIEQVVADMPERDSDELLVEARARMILATV